MQVKAGVKLTFLIRRSFLLDSLALYELVCHIESDEAAKIYKWINLKADNLLCYQKRAMNNTVSYVAV